MDKELRKELKRDDLQDAMKEARGFFERSELAKPVLAVLGLFVGLWALYSFQKYRAGAAEAAFSKAFDTFHAPIGEPRVKGGLSFKTSKERYERARDEFDAIAKSSSPAGRRARYFAAISRLELGETAAAEAELKSLAAIRDASQEPGLARLMLADLAIRSGRTQEAVASFTALLSDMGSGIPKDRLMFGLAEALEASGDKIKARDAYQDLANKFPQSAYASDARKKSSELAASL